MIKKYIVSILFLTLLVSSSLAIYATEQQDSVIYNYEELGVEVVFDGNTAFSEEQQQRIADILAYDTNPVEGRAWCWLTGHNYVVDAVSVITHKLTEYSPRCLRQTYEVTTCEKCNYYSEELLGSVYIFCCPEE